MWEFYKRHERVINLFLAVAGIVTGFWFWWIERDVIEVSYIKSTVKIIESDDLGPSISVSDKKGNTLMQDVFVSEYIVWNSGNQALDKELVRKNLAFTAETGEIVDARITAQTHPDVARFRLTSVGDPPGEYQVSWDYFDPGFGFKALIISQSENDPRILLEGHILGIGNNLVELERFKTEATLGYWRAVGYKYGLISAFVAYVAGLLILSKADPLFFLRVFRSFQYKMPQGGPSWILALVLTFVVMILMLGAVSAPIFMILVYFLDPQLPSL